MKVCARTVAIVALVAAGVEAGRPDRTRRAAVAHEVASSAVQLSETTPEPSVDETHQEEDAKHEEEAAHGGAHETHSVNVRQIEEEVDKQKHMIDSKFDLASHGVDKVKEEVALLKPEAKAAGEAAQKLQKEIGEEVKAVKELHNAANKVDSTKKAFGFEVAKWLADNEKKRVAPLTGGEINTHAAEMKVTFDAEKFKSDVNAKKQHLEAMINGIRAGSIGPEGDAKGEEHAARSESTEAHQLEKEEVQESDVTEEDSTDQKVEEEEEEEEEGKEG